MTLIWFHTVIQTYYAIDEDQVQEGAVQFMKRDGGIRNADTPVCFSNLCGAESFLFTK